ncbi:unnamed protein product [Arctia plantaginis]|uniref:DUF659 domain-containing protein n=1 Tax=Arctia plantaginis TaxID=874455 RepID=A0A8S0ZB45_ARCPL|nr:unnamed protein product [Arctia plantaginis]
MHLQLDGWSNINNEGVINFIISKPEPVFVESLNTEQNRHTSEYLREEILKVMRTYREDKFVVVIGDNARNIQKTFQLVKEVQPHDVPLNCAAHTINLLAHDVLKCEGFNNFIKLCIDVIKSIKKSQVLGSKLQQIVKLKKSGEKFKLPCCTR